jgi:sugar/nucleoside kinase (ribokinase family)
MGKAMSRDDLPLKRAARSASIIGSGFIALDVVQGQDGSFVATGGSCGNVMMALAWLGWKAMPVARLGRDKAGDFLRSDMKSMGVSLELLQRSEAVPTPVVIQRFVEDASGRRRHRFSLVCPECGAWLPRYRNVLLTHSRKVVKGTLPTALYFDRVSPATVEMAEWAKQNGAVVLFEPSTIGEDSLFQRAVDASHILKFSSERFSKYSELSQARGPLLVVRTMGARGLQARWQGRWISCEPLVAPKLVDAAGAGDWCSVGLLHALAQKKPQSLSAANWRDILGALRLGQALAALNCGFEGARGLMSAAATVDDLNRMLRKMVGGDGVFKDIERTPPRAKRVEICKICSDTARMIGSTRKATSGLSKKAKSA